MSPGATAVADLLEPARPRLTQALAVCIGDRELEAMGFHSDVGLTASLDVSWVEFRSDV